MIPILYSSTIGAPVTTGMGMGPLADCIECTCYEEVNGEFECTFKYPYTGSLYPYIRKGAIVAAKPSPAYGNVYQQFKIYKISKPINGIITVNAHHISYELSGLPVGPFDFEDATPQVIMNELYDASLISDNRFVFHSDLIKKINISSSVPKNLREVMLGTENSIASTSKNEFSFNNYSVSLLEARGQATEIEIIYGRELVDYNQEESIENAYSHFVAYAITKNTNGEDMIVGTSPGAIQLIDPVTLGHQKCLIRDFTGDFENSDEITQSNLAVKAAKYIENNKLSIPSINFRLSFVDLKKNPEYSDIITAFGNIGLGDNIKVLIQKLGITAKARIIATTYDVLKEEFISVDVGSRRENVADTIYKLQKNNKTVAHSVAALRGNNKYPSEHTHDDRYPTKTEVFVAIAGSISELGTGLDDRITQAQNNAQMLISDLSVQAEMKLSGKSDKNHNHDDRYCTEAKTEALISEARENAEDFAQEIVNGLEAQTEEKLYGKSDKSHIHDERYYTEAETDELISTAQNNAMLLISDLRAQTEMKLSGKSDKNHNHDDRYCTEAKTEALISEARESAEDYAQGLINDLETQTSEQLFGKSDKGHTHDERYYTETETDNLISQAQNNAQLLVSNLSAQTETKLSGKSDKNHTHDDIYCSEARTEELVSQARESAEDYAQELINEFETDINDKLFGKSDKGHTHDERYYTESEVNSLLSGKSDKSHTHDDRYYTETEVNTKLSGKSDTSHTHDDRYYTEAETDELISQASYNAHLLISDLQTQTNTKLSGKSNTDHQHWYLKSANSDNTIMLNTAGSVYPLNDLSQDLGVLFNSGDYKRFRNVNCQKLQEVSDIRLKDDLNTNIDSYINMLDLINPTSYLFKSDIKDGINKRNIGYIAQEVQEALHSVGLKDSDFAGLVYDEEAEKNGAYSYGLSYSQFIPIIHAKIKQLEEKYNAKIAECERRIAELNEKNQ